MATKKKEATSSKFDVGGFIGTLVGIFILVLVLFLLRNKIGAKIDQWRNSGISVAPAPVLPIITVSPAPTTPTPKPVVVYTPVPTIIPVIVSTPAPVPAKLPKSGPADELGVVALAAGGIAAAAGTGRYQLLRYKLKRQSNKINIV